MSKGTLQRILRLPRAKLLLRLEAAALLLSARVALRMVPFPVLAARLGTLQPPSAIEPNDSQASALTVREVAQAINAAAVNAPLELVCLPRALAAWQMLHWRGVPSQLHFGKPSAGPAQRQLHAWLTSSGVPVTGFPVALDCVEIGCFVRAARGETKRIGKR